MLSAGICMDTRAETPPSRGSILISTELASSGSRPDGQHSAVAMAEQVLATFVGLNSVSEPGSSQDVHVQVDDVHLRCSWVDELWQFQVDRCSTEEGSSERAYLQDEFKLRLPVPTCSAASTGHEALLHPKQSSEPAGHWLIRLQLCSKFEQRDFLVQGSHPDLPAQPLNTADLAQGQPILQLLTQSATSFLRTQVLSCTPCSPSQPGLYTLEVAVHAGPQQLVCHHPGGPVMGLQPITFQLWYGDVWFSSISTLLSIDNMVSRPACLAPQQCCSWWGASPEAARACVTELHDLAQRLWQDGNTTAEHVQGHQAFMHDINTWLTAVVMAGGLQHRCVCVAGRHVYQFPDNNSCFLSQALSIGDSLLAYTREVSLVRTQQFIKAQYAVVHQAHDQLSSAATASISPLSRLRHTVRQWMPAVRAEMWGYSCPHCEALYNQRAVSFLSPVRVCANISFVLAGAVAVMKEQHGLEQAACVMVALPSFVMLVLMLMGINRGTAALSVAASLLCTITKALCTLGVLPMLHPLQQQQNWLPWFVMRITFTWLDISLLTGVVSRRTRFSLCACNLPVCPLLGQLTAWAGKPLELLQAAVVRWLIAAGMFLSTSLHISTWIMTKHQPTAAAAAVHQHKD